MVCATFQQKFEELAGGSIMFYTCFYEANSILNRNCLGSRFRMKQGRATPNLEQSNLLSGNLLLIYPGEGISYPFQSSGLENSMDCIVHGVAKSWTWLSNFHFTSLSLWLEDALLAHICPSYGLAVEVGPFSLCVVLQVPPTFHCSAREWSAGPGIPSLISFFISVGFSATPIAHLCKKLRVPAEAITAQSSWIGKAPPDPWMGP